MRIVCLIVICALILLFSGCGSDSSTPPNAGSPASTAPVTGKPPSGSSGAVAPFLDERKALEPHQEWNREVTSRIGGTISYRVTSQGPFAVTVITAAGYQAMVARERVDKAAILLTIDSPGSRYEGQVTIPAGSCYFIIENQTNMKADEHLQCYPPK